MRGMRQLTRQVWTAIKLSPIQSNPSGGLVVSTLTAPCFVGRLAMDMKPAGELPLHFREAGAVLLGPPNCAGRVRLAVHKKNPHVNVAVRAMVAAHATIIPDRFPRPLNDGLRGRFPKVRRIDYEGRRRARKMVAVKTFDPPPPLSMALAGSPKEGVRRPGLTSESRLLARRLRRHRRGSGSADLLAAAFGARSKPAQPH